MGFKDGVDTRSVDRVLNDDAALWEIANYASDDYEEEIEDQETGEEE